MVLGSKCSIDILSTIQVSWGLSKLGEKTSPTVKAHWNVTDPESGIQYCQYGIGRYSLDIVEIEPGKIHGFLSEDINAPWFGIHPGVPTVDNHVILT
jgi:hypothetical protein